MDLQGSRASPHSVYVLVDETVLLAIVAWTLGWTMEAHRRGDHAAARFWARLLWSPCWAATAYCALVKGKHFPQGTYAFLLALRTCAR